MDHPELFQSEFTSGLKQRGLVTYAGNWVGEYVADFMPPANF